MLPDAMTPGIPSCRTQLQGCLFAGNACVNRLCAAHCCCSCQLKSCITISRSIELLIEPNTRLLLWLSSKYRLGFWLSIRELLSSRMDWNTVYVESILPCNLSRHNEIKTIKCHWAITTTITISIVSNFRCLNWFHIYVSICIQYFLVWLIFIKFPFHF